MSENTPKYYEYKLEAELLCISERMKKGNYRPCVKTIPFSTITGALKATYFNRNSQVFAAGYLTHVAGREINTLDDLNNLEPKISVISPQDKVTDTARTGIAPIRIEYLENVVGKVFVLATDEVKEKIGSQTDPLEIYLGGYLSKSMGKCRLTRVLKERELTRKTGKLRTRIPLEYLDKFGISANAEKIKARYCYLYEPVPGYEPDPAYKPDPRDPFKPNRYLLSLMEGSEVEGLELFIYPGELK